MSKLNNHDNYHEYKSTTEGSNGGGGGIGGGWIVVVVVVFMLISFIADGASWDAIETLLALGFIVFLLAR